MDTFSQGFLDRQRETAAVEAAVEQKKNFGFNQMRAMALQLDTHIQPDCVLGLGCRPTRKKAVPLAVLAADDHRTAVPLVLRSCYKQRPFRLGRHQLRCKLVTVRSEAVPHQTPLFLSASANRSHASETRPANMSTAVLHMSREVPYELEVVQPIMSHRGFFRYVSRSTGPTALRSKSWVCIVCAKLLCEVMGQVGRRQSVTGCAPAPATTVFFRR
jgi:hypothetical protein